MSPKTLMPDNSKCRQLLASHIAVITDVFKNHILHKTDEILSCFYKCFQDTFIKWAFITYNYPPADFIDFISANAFNDSVEMFARKAAEGAIYDGHASMRTVVFSFYCNKLREYLQTEKRLEAKKEKHKHDENVPVWLLEHNETPAAEQMYQAIEKAMANMEPMDRQIITWRHLEGKPNEEIARLLGITTESATNRIFRCMQRLKSLMNKENAYE